MRCISENNIRDVVVCDEAEWKNLILGVVGKYVDENKAGHQLWERLLNTESYVDADGWKIMGTLIGNKKCILFLDEERFCLKISNGILLQKILEETYNFVFYITDQRLSYLLCHNDHDFVIACGDARNWIAKPNIPFP